MYGPQLQEIMAKILLLSDVALLADEIECTTAEKDGYKFGKSVISHKSMNGWLYANAPEANSDADLTGLDFVDNSEFIIEQSMQGMENENKEIAKQSNWSWLPKGKKFKLKLLKLAHKKLDKLIEGKDSSNSFETEALLGGDWEEPLKKDDVSLLCGCFRFIFYDS
jgi:hypothetical protein